MDQHAILQLLRGMAGFLSLSNIWTCPICSHENQIIHGNKCTKCAAQNVHEIHDNDFLDPTHPVWTCSRCAWLNQTTAQNCNKCGLKRAPTDVERPILINTATLIQNTRTSITVRDRQRKDSDDASETYRNIVNYCTRMKTNFIDDEFRPTDENVGPHHLDHVDRWLRISEIAPTSRDDRHLKWTVFSSPKPTDIEQGALGNCWLVAVMALICEKPALLDQIVLTKEVNDIGAYMIRVCHNGVWKTIIVDDCFPATRHKHLVFTKAKRRQMYIPLIEKACAKLFKSYESLRSGTLMEGLQLMTGAPCTHINLRPHSEPFEPDVIWARLLSATEAKLLIGASTGGTNATHEEYKEAGINGNHAFSILAAYLSKEVGSNRFILVRDPHSTAQYRERHLRPEYLEILKKVNPAQRSEGAFWIVWPTFLKFFSSITISTYNSDHFDVREVGRFTRDPTHWPLTYSFNLDKGSEITVSLLYHRQARKSRNHHVQSFVLCDVESNESGRVEYGKRVHILKSQRGGFNYWSEYLPAGHYVVIPFSMSFWYNEKAKTTDFTLVIHSPNPMEITPKRQAPEYLAKCLIPCAIKSDSKRSQSGDGVLYTKSDDSGLHILVFENRSTNKFSHVEFELHSEKSAIRHSRGEFKTSDSIPPLHRQIVWMFEWNLDEQSSASARWTYSTSFISHSLPSKPSIGAVDLHKPQPF